MKLYAYRDLSKCTKDCLCLYVCPTGATDTENGQIDFTKCTGCGICANACPNRAITILPAKYPTEQLHTDKVKAILKRLLDSKSKQELMLEGLSQDSKVAKTLAVAFAKSNRIMCEDLIRESGFMIPQGVEAFKFFEDLLNKNNYGISKDEIKQLIAWLKKDPTEAETVKTKKWVCPICGYTHEGDTPPEQCPVCFTPGSDFVLQ